MLKNHFFTSKNVENQVYWLKITLFLKNNGFEAWKKVKKVDRVKKRCLVVGKKKKVLSLKL